MSSHILNKFAIRRRSLISNQEINWIRGRQYCMPDHYVPAAAIVGPDISASLTRNGNFRPYASDRHNHSAGPNRYLCSYQTLKRSCTENSSTVVSSMLVWVAVVIRPNPQW